MSQGQPVKVVPAVNEVPPDAPVGERPYEMVWAQRQEERRPLVDWEDLSGWRVECYEGAEAHLERSREQQMWGQYVGKVTYRGTSPRSFFVLRPPQPIPIPDRFDSINLWAYGNNWGWAPDPTTPQVELVVRLRDAEGKEVSVPLRRVNWKEWWLVHRRVPRETLESLRWPVAFAGLEVRGGANQEERVLFFDSLSFYTEELRPLRFEPRPQRNLTLFEGQDPGLNTGPGRLPFPTREETILPLNFAHPFRNEVEQEGTAVFLFRYQGPDGEVAYRWDATVPHFRELTVWLNGQRVGRPLFDAGVRFEEEVDEPRLERVERKGEVVEALYRFPLKAQPERGYEVLHRLRIWQKSLVVDAICRGGVATEFSFGRVVGVRQPELITVPFITYGASNPPVLMAQGEESEAAVFFGLWPDWYRSNASEPYATPGVEWDEEGRTARVSVNGGVRYRPKTDGRRNDLYERLFLTVSPRFEEVLPSIPNPPSPLGKLAGERLWQESWGPADYKREHERSRRLRAYGIEKLTQCNHEITWRDGGESFTLRIRAAPKKGGDEALQWFLRAQQSLGWLAGLYTNYCDYAPVNEHWDEDGVIRLPDGEWQTAWPRCYALKPSRAVEFDRRLAPVIQQKFGSNAAYTDVHTAVSPWGRCDYDARVPGAGTFAQTFYLFGELLLHDQSVYGPTWSEGTYQWLYAGLATGNYGLCYSGPNLSQYPFLPVFDLLHIHPKEVDIGMPWTAGFFGNTPGWNAPERIEQSIDHFLAATIAYGHIGWLVEEAHGIRRTCRSYYLLQQLQKRYAMEEVADIRYYDARKGQEVSVSEALASGAWRDSQVHIAYRNGLQVWVNGHRERSWEVSWEGEPVLLPPFGWAAAWPADAFFTASAEVKPGHRVDWVWSGEYLYLDGRDKPATDPLGEKLPLGLEAKGGVAVRALDENTLEVINIGGNDWIGFGGGTFPPNAPATDVRRVVAQSLRRRPARAEAFDAEGNALGEAELRFTPHRNWLKAEEKAVRYVVVLGPERAAARLEVGVKPTYAPKEGIVAATVSVHAPQGMMPRVQRIRLGWEGQTFQELSGRTLAGLTLKVLETALPWERLWIRAEAETSQGPLSAWGTLVAAPMAEWRWEPKMVEMRGGQGSLVLYGGLHLRGIVQYFVETRLGARALLTSPGWLRVEPNSWDVQEEKVRQEVRFVLLGEPKEDTLVVGLRAGDQFAHQPFRLRPERFWPVFYNLTDRRWPLRWVIAFRGREEEPGRGDTGASFHHERGIPCGGVKRDGFFSHPPYRGGVGYTAAYLGPLTLPQEPCEVHLWVGLRDGGDPSDGVDFSLWLRPEGGLWQRLFLLNWKERAWKEVRADLTPWAGQKVWLKFVADVGPNDNSVADWASWGEPVIRAKEPSWRLHLEPLGG